jgi:hypothetical protein
VPRLLVLRVVGLFRAPTGGRERRVPRAEHQFRRRSCAAARSADQWRARYAAPTRSRVARTGLEQWWPRRGR